MYPFTGDDRALTLLKRGCANSVVGLELAELCVGIPFNEKTPFVMTPCSILERLGSERHRKDLILPREVCLSPGEVEHTLGLLWMGVTGGAWHMDMQDNILMQLSGEADVFVFPANCTFNGSEVLHVRGWI